MALANIVLADAQGTPVNHTFVPLGPDENGVLWFEDQSPSSPIGFWRISVALTRPSPNGVSSNGRVYRAKVTLAEPTLETVGTNDAGITPAPSVAYTTRAMLEVLLPERGTLLDRKNIRKMFYNLLNESQTVALIETLIKPY